MASATAAYRNDKNEVTASIETVVQQQQQTEAAHGY